MSLSDNNQQRIPDGTMINGCRITGEIGAGGMGSVYRAYDESLSRTVAIKVMHQTSAKQPARTRFLREATAIAHLDHPGIVKIYSFGEFEGQPYFIMEHVDGWSIKDFTGRCRLIHLSGHAVADLKLSGYLKESPSDRGYFHQDPEINPLRDTDFPGRVRQLMHSAASALAAAHQQGIIHRDIKSSNILISNDSQVKIVDFGLVKHRDDSELTSPDQFMGTLSYAAPEQLMGARGKLTPLTDIYGLGVVMYELVTMTHPIPGDDPAAMVAAITNGSIIPPSALNPHISREFEAIMMKCLEKNPDKRFAGAAELAEALANESSQPTWFSGFTDMLKGWFVKESRPVRQPRQSWTGVSDGSFALQPEPDSQQVAGQRFLKTARKKFFHNFAVLEAIEDLKQAYALDPANTDTLFLLCFAYNAIGARTEIKPLIEKSTNLISQSSEKDHGKFDLTREVFLNRDYEEGRKKSIRLQQIYTDDQDFQFALFFCLEALGNYSEAIKVGEKLSQLSKKNNVVAIAQSECYFSIMDFDKAIAVLKERISLNPEFHNLRLKCIQALILSGKLQQARHEAEEVLRQDPLNMLMQFYYGRILVFCNDYQLAFSVFRKVVGLPGDEGLRATGYYSIYRLLELQGKSESARKYLKQAQKINPEMALRSNKELQETVSKADLPGIKDEITDEDWFATVLDYTHRICVDSADIRSYTIGNYGCTSILRLNDDDSIEQHTIFSNYNLYEGEELFAQLWLPEYAQSPFIDENGNILTSDYHRHDGRLSGGIASIALAAPWKSGCGSHIYCRLQDVKLQASSGKRMFVLPPRPQPALRRQAFLIVLPLNASPTAFSQQPDEAIFYKQHQVLCFYPYLFAGEVFSLSFELPKNS